MLVGWDSCTESGAARVMAQGLQVGLRYDGSNSKHGTMLKGQHDGPEDGIRLRERERDKVNELEGFASHSHLLYGIVNDFSTPKLCY